MKIDLKRISVADLVKEYQNNPNEGGVVGYGGKLNIRPAYQREFVYKEKQRDAVIETIKKGFPLNTMYWVVNRNNDNDELYEVLDGQQRTISICEYVSGSYSLNYRYFHNLTDHEKEHILNYELMIYFCEGNDKEKLDWFKVINIAGEKLTNQELLNAIYTGTWLTAAKKYFSKTGCPAQSISSDYMKGSPIRQEYLETVISWISNNQIEYYMATHQHDKNASELWLYFNRVIEWVKTTFPSYRKEMKGIEWGELYNSHHNDQLDPETLENRIKQLMQDEDVTSKKGIYEYLLSGDQKHLNVRVFDDKMKREAYERQNGVCPITKKHYSIEDMEADHIIPWSQGGKTNAENCQMIEKMANRTKSNK
jgi:uncharacterized protein with ParB-like and HNH nuclease domain